MDIKRLKRTYEALCNLTAERGDATAYEVANALGETHEVTQEALDKLADLGLVRDQGPVTIECYHVL